MHGPRVLLLDEPTVGLDVHSRAELVAHVRGLVRESGLAVLWATHLTDEVCAGDHLVVLHRGRVLQAGPATATGGALTAQFLRLTGERQAA
jgi:ABC-2 type transport system ATP-binding protein